MEVESLEISQKNFERQIQSASGKESDKVKELQTMLQGARDRIQQKDAQLREYMENSSKILQNKAKEVEVTTRSNREKENKVCFWICRALMLPVACSNPRAARKDRSTTVPTRRKQ